VTGPVAIPPTLTLEGSEGVVLRLGADGKTYTLLLFTGAPGGTAVAHGGAGRCDRPVGECSTVVLLTDVLLSQLS
jgi:hypothetical protein